MKKIFFRVDDRGIHDQIIFGWVERLNIKEVILCDDFTEDLVVGGLKAEVSFSIRSPEEKGKIRLKDKTLIITPSLKVAWKVISGGLPVKEVNIGGVRYQRGKKRFFNRVYLSAEDIAYLKKITRAGIKVFFQELPDSKRYDFNI